MQRGYYYKHVCAPDIFIDVLNARLVGPRTQLIKCRVFNTWTLTFHEVTEFELPREKLGLWELYSPRSN